MGRFVHRFVNAWRETTVMVASNKKGDLLFAINALSEDFFDKNEDNEAYTALIEEYFGESGDETEANTDDEEGV